MKQRNKILICRSAKDSADWIPLMQSHGMDYAFFPVFEVVPTSGEELAVLRPELTAESGFDWLVLSSRYGVQILSALLGEWNVSLKKTFKIGLVGAKTVALFGKVFPDYPVDCQANGLRQLLEEIILLQNPVSVLSLTSNEGLENIDIDIPARISLQRKILYRLQPCSNHNAQILDAVRQGVYNIFIFSSPSSFKYFRMISGIKTLLKNAVIATLGKTTAAYIRAEGFYPAIVPVKPDKEELISLISNWKPDDHGANANGQKPLVN